MSENASYRDMANALRALAMDAVQKANSGHPGMPMGMADVATVLFTRFIKGRSGASRVARSRSLRALGRAWLDAALCPAPSDRLPAHDARPAEELSSARQPHAGPFGIRPWVETTTGPLGQGISNAVGMALAERLLAVRYGDDVVDHYTYVLASDGDLMEGVSHEAISLAGHLRLGKLIVLFDDNRISIDGPISLSSSSGSADPISGGRLGGQRDGRAQPDRDRNCHRLGAKL